MSYAAAVAVFVLVPAAWGVAFLAASSVTDRDAPAAPLRTPQIMRDARFREDGGCGVGVLPAAVSGSSRASSTALAAEAGPRGGAPRVSQSTDPQLRHRRRRSDRTTVA